MQSASTAWLRSLDGVMKGLPIAVKRTVVSRPYQSKRELAVVSAPVIGAKLWCTRGTSGRLTYDDMNNSFSKARSFLRKSAITITSFTTCLCPNRSCESKMPKQHRRHASLTAHKHIFYIRRAYVSLDSSVKLVRSVSIHGWVSRLVLKGPYCAGRKVRW